MALSPKLEVRQSQALVMTPQLQQAIKLLQLSNLELSAYVEQELERNPILERAEDEGPAQDHADGETPNGDAADLNGREVSNDTAASSDDNAGEGSDGVAEAADLPESDFDVSTTADAGDGNPIDDEVSRDVSGDSASDAPQESQSSEDGYGLQDWGASSGGSGGARSEEFSLEHVLSHVVTLKEHLQEQLGASIHDPAERMIGAELIESIDEAGYLTDDVITLAARLGCGVNEVDRVISKMQQFDPTGVFARDLGDCLALQLRERDRLDPAMQTLLENLPLLGKMDIAALTRVCGVDDEDVRDMIAEIKALDPKPGLAFDHEVATPVIPDVFVRERPGGGWSVELNSETLPRLLVNRHYYAEVNQKTRNREEKTYLSECLQSANWLIKSLDQRARTILKVATELVRQQDGFLTYGVQHLKPLNLRTIAEKVDIHESTVSRVTANKYLATPRGIFEFKYFFTSAISSSLGGDDVSSEAVRQRIRELVDAETPEQVLSDDKLVSLLRSNGIDIARRTVAKYREAMGIPSSVQRRRLKRMHA